MHTTNNVNYRRKPNRLEWHFNPSCKKYPTDKFVEVKNGDGVQSNMICPICVRTTHEEESIAEKEPETVAAKSGFIGFLKTEVFGLS